MWIRSHGQVSSLEQSLLQGGIRKVPVLDTYMGVLSCIWSMCNVYCPLYIDGRDSASSHRVSVVLWQRNPGLPHSPALKTAWLVLITSHCLSQCCLLGMISAFCSREETEPWFSATGVYLASRLMYEKCVVPPYLLTVS